MSGIYINISRIRSANDKIPAVAEIVARTDRAIRNQRRQMPDETEDQQKIGQRLDGICENIESLERQIHELYRITNSCMMQYEAAEYENSRNAGLFL